jgi:hypothetical protein
MRSHLSIFAGCLFGVASCAAIAQAPPSPATPPQQTAPAAPSSQADCARTSPDGATVGRSGKPLGDKLAESEGVLCPPAGIDPEIRAPTPDTRDKPAIPPPGSPGGDPNVRPK